MNDKHNLLNQNKYQNSINGDYSAHFTDQTEILRMGRFHINWVAAQFFLFLTIWQAKLKNKP